MFSDKNTISLLKSKAPNKNLGHETFLIYGDETIRR